MKVRVSVRLKASILDPQGKTVQKASQQMGYDEVASVRIGKLIELEVNSDASEESKARIEDLCRKLLTNPQLETYDIEWLD